MKDYLIRAVGEKEQFRVFAVVATNLIEEARRRHDTWPVATAALGRTLIAGLLMGANLKGEDLLTIRINGDGPLGGIVVSADAYGNVRGYVKNPQVHVSSISKGKLGVGTAVGKGTLSVSKDLGLKEPFTGSVELISGEIGEDISYYLTVSEQIPSAVSLGVLVETDNSVRAAGGLILQLLPGASDDIISKLEAGIKELPPISSLVDEGKTPEQIVDLALKELNFSILEQTPVQFNCPCNKDKVESILISLGKQEIQEIKEELGQAEVNCHFCGEKYIFNTRELDNLLKEIEQQ
ncbi:Hsp33 family molecular chaperone HslO [Desulfolucanica intricata]|uniref:Hsp33 family molecular chaperone HslO n=1 Tax=Desulfolucanica intricata TaxID=1285191 RepID=UPI00083456BA|nr:Hsp33 family molecular chaperone HslO [Desulfolucanica intricata]